MKRKGRLTMESHDIAVLRVDAGDVRGDLGPANIIRENLLTAVENCCGMG
jgi:hypothetical protein